MFGVCLIDTARLEFVYLGSELFRLLGSASSPAEDTFTEPSPKDELTDDEERAKDARIETVT